METSLSEPLSLSESREAVNPASAAGKDIPVDRPYAVLRFDFRRRPGRSPNEGLSRSPAQQRADEIQNVLQEAKAARVAAEEARWIREKLAEPRDWKSIVRHHLGANGDKVKCVYVDIYVYIHIYMYMHIYRLNMYIYVHTCICIYVPIYICVYIYIYKYIYQYVYQYV